MKKAKISLIIILALLVASLPSLTTASAPSSINIYSSGIITSASSAIVQVNTMQTIALNNLSLGTALQSHWINWVRASIDPQLAQNAGIKLVCIYDYQMSCWNWVSLMPCSYWNETTSTGVFNWTYVDSLVNTIYKIGAEPLIVLGGTAGTTQVHFPNGMAINATTGLPNPNSFASYATDWVKHFQSVGLPVRFYDVFNEPELLYLPSDNLKSYNPTELSYIFSLYNASYYAMHRVNSQILVSNDAALYKTFLDYCISVGGKLDYLPFHDYDCNGPSEETSAALATTETRYFVSDSIFYGANDARAKLKNPNLIAVASEANFAATFVNGSDPRLQQVVGAVWLALLLRTEMLQNVQYNAYFCFSDSQSANLALSSNTNGGFGFGMVNDDNYKPYYPYFVYKLIGPNLSIGDPIVSSSVTANNLRVLAWEHSGKLYTLLISESNSPTIVNLSGFSTAISYSLIDNSIPYTNAQLQTGVVNASNQVFISGYAVLLLQSNL